MALTRNTNQRNSSWNAPYTFSGKEKDAETGYGYFGARYYDSGLSIWLSVDPMSDKYPSMSPYNYCANNPVMLVDPDGQDIYEFDVNGTFIKSTDSKFDQIIIKDGKDIKSMSGEYKKGTIKNINTKKGDQVAFEVTDKSQASSIYEFCADRDSKVEWEGLTFKNGKSFIVAGSEGKTDAGSQIINTQNSKGNKLIQHIHNHTDGNIQPSGQKSRYAIINNNPQIKGDIDARQLLIKTNPEVRTYIYNSNKYSPQYQEYDQNGTKGMPITKTPF